MSVVNRFFRREPTPLPPPVPTPVAPMVRVKVDDGAQSIAATGGSLLLDWNRQTITATIDAGVLVFTLPIGAPMPFGAFLHTSVADYDDFNDRIVLAPDVNVTVRKRPTVRPLHVDGLWFATDDGQPWTQIGCSDFQLLQRFLAGEDIEPVLIERAAIGFNQLRVFLMCHGMFHLYPHEHADYLPKLKTFLDRLAAHGLRAELTVLVDATKVMPDLGQQQRFFVDVCAAVAGRPDVFVELVNEAEQTINVIQTGAFSRPSGLICSHGSKGVVDAAQEPVCVVPVWVYASLHPGRGPDWPRLGHNIDEDIAQKFHVPGTINESCRPNQGRGPIASDFFDAAANIALMGAGGTFHSEGGKLSLHFTGDERRCADAWVAGAKAVDLGYQRGAYIAPHLVTPIRFPIAWSEGDSARAHGRLVGNRACLSLPQMRQGYVPRAVDGWRIVKQTGSVVECER